MCKSPVVEGTQLVLHTLRSKGMQSRHQISLEKERGAHGGGPGGGVPLCPEREELSEGFHFRNGVNLHAVQKEQDSEGVVMAEEAGSRY